MVHGRRKGGKRSKSKTMYYMNQKPCVHVELVHDGVKVKHRTAQTDTIIFVMQ